MMGDMQEYFTSNDIRNFYSVSISGYHIAEAGANLIIISRTKKDLDEVSKKIKKLKSKCKSYVCDLRNYMDIKQIINKKIKNLTEYIDVCGSAMIRAAAKNHNSVAVVVDKDDYGLIIEELKKDGKVLEKTLKNLALKAYSRTAAYDSAISNWMSKQVKDGDQTYKSFGGKKIQSLRYGENPHQESSIYVNDYNDKHLGLDQLLKCRFCLT